MAQFNQFALKTALVNALKKAGYHNLTPVQEAAIPSALRGDSLIVRSSTGSGKTHAFLVPVLNSIKTEHKAVQALILVPTRELAQQTYEFAKKLQPAIRGLKIAQLAGGVDKSRSKAKLSTIPHLVIATPGRLEELGFNDTVISLQTVKTIVLDETDMLLDDGFFPTIDNILGFLPDAQVMVYSATITPSLANLIGKYLKNAKRVELGEETPVPNLIDHYAIDTRHKEVVDVIKDFIKWRNPYFLLIFASKKSDVATIGDQLINDGLKVGVLHGDLSSRERKVMMKRIRLGDFSIVLASDIAARGIDLPNVSDVLSIDLGNNTEYYFHRAGRSGRFDQTGSSFLLYDKDRLSDVRKISDQGVKFQYLTYRSGDFVSADKPPRNSVRTKVVDTALQRDINKAVSQNKTTKVKPGYKRKVRDAVKKVKQKHRREMIRKDIRRQREERYKAQGRINNE